MTTAASSADAQQLPEAVAAFVNSLPGTSRLLVAYSGGMDSHVLLHLMVSLAAPVGHRLRAAHVNHNLQSRSSAWADHCQRVCAALGVELQVLDINIPGAARGNLESRARAARYGALHTVLQEGETLLTAHHQDDQVETLLLRLLRGAGPLGLAAMRASRTFGSGMHARPLLACARAQLLQYARSHRLEWVEDPTNAELNRARNYVRHELLPMIKKRWPSVALPVTRAIRVQAETQVLLDEIAAGDLADAATTAPAVLRVDRVRSLSMPRQTNLLRYWIRSLNLPPPGSAQLAHIRTDLLRAEGAASGRVAWSGAALRRYRNYLCLEAPPPDGDCILNWDLRRPCRLPDGVLRAVAGRGAGLRRDAADGVQVRYRRGGERILLPGRAGRSLVKKLFQQAGVPPWMRARVPFIYVGDRLAQVVGLWFDAGFLAREAEESWHISWNRSAELRSFPGYQGPVSDLPD